jgi:hypothetical protein
LVFTEERETRASSEPFAQDPYVARVVDLCRQSVFFGQGEAQLAKLRSELLQLALAFFARRHPEFYRTHFQRLDVTPDNVTMADLPRLALTAEQLRGEGQRNLIVPGIPLGGATFQSSGTTGGRPVTIYRSQLDFFVQRCANGLFWEHMLARDSQTNGGGTCLFMASPELRSRMSFVGFVSEFMEHRQVEMVFGLKLREETADAKTVWERLTPDRAAIARFFDSHRFPKFIFSTPAGIYNLIRSTPPVRLGRGGAIAMGGGSKGGEVPPLEELMRLAGNHFRAEDTEGRETPAPIIDILGFTESLTIFPSRPFSLVKHPHPFTEVFIVDQKNLHLVDDAEGEGLLGFWNPLCTSYFEAVYPGLVVKRVRAEDYHGRGFLVKRRMTPEEGWQLQRACGEAFGQAFGKS